VAVRERLSLARPQGQVGQARVLGLELLAREARLLDVAEAVLGGMILGLLQVPVRKRDR